MWNELESYKHHFLQSELKHMKPIEISPLVRAEFDDKQARRKACRSPRPEHVKTGRNETPICQQSTYFDDHAQLAYGWFALPKLLRELCSDDFHTQWRAINSLSEFVMNPLHAQRAINEKDLVRLLKNAFLRHRSRFFMEKYHEVEKMLEIFRILAIYLNGARQIAKRNSLCDEFYKIILGSEKHTEITSAILRNLSEKPEVLLLMLENSKAYEHLSKIFHTDNCRPAYPYALWMHLSHFLEIAPERGMELGFFELFHQRIVGNLPKYHRLNMKCLALILRCAEGQRRFDEIDGVAVLYKIISNDLLLLDTYEYVVMALLHGLQSKNAMWRCREFTDLPKILTKFAFKKTHRNKHLQLYALKTLRQLGEMPCIKEYMRLNCGINLKILKCLNEENECERDRLVKWLERDIFETAEDE